MYGYSIRYPKGWQVTPAAVAWSGIEPVPGGEADVLSPGGQQGMYRELTVVSTPAEGASLEDWAAAHALLPKEYKVVGKDAYCFFGALGGTKMTDATVSLTDGEIDGRHALIRGICGHISATVLVDDRIFVLSLFANLQREGDPATFDAIMETVDFDLSIGLECRRLQAFLKGPGGRSRHGQRLPSRQRLADRLGRWPRSVSCSDSSCSSSSALRLSAGPARWASCGPPANRAHRFAALGRCVDHAE